MFSYYDPERAIAAQNKKKKVRYNRTDWPFHNLEVGETCCISDMGGRSKSQMSSLIHAHGKLRGRKYKTKSMDGQYFVMRVE